MGKLTPVYISVAKFSECFTAFEAPLYTLGKKNNREKKKWRRIRGTQSHGPLTTLLAETLWETLVGFESETRGGGREKEEEERGGAGGKKNRLEASGFTLARPRTASRRTHEECGATSALFSIHLSLSL